MLVVYRMYNSASIPDTNVYRGFWGVFGVPYICGASLYFFPRFTVNFECTLHSVVENKIFH